ncbi:MAG: PH domain-containing protein [Candidatus Dormibacteria bacterium]
MLLLLPLQELLKNLPFLVVLVLVGNHNGGAPLWALIGLGVTVAAGTLRWFTTGYRISPEQVQVRRGLLRRRNLTVPRDRIRTVDLTAHVLHRVLGLASVNIGTGRSDRKDDRGLKLDGLRAGDAAWIRQELLHRPLPASAEAGPAAPQVRELARWRPSWVAYGPFTLSGAVTVLALVAFGAQVVNEAHLNLARLVPVQQVLGHAAATSLGVVVLALVVCCLVLISVGSTLGYILSFWHFQLTQEAGTLQVTRGLLTTRVVSIDQSRLRGVELSEPLLLRWVHGARCIAIATGLRVGRGSERGGSILLPPSPKALGESVAAAVSGSSSAVTCALREHGPTARRRRYSRALLATLPALLVLLALWLAGVVPVWPSILGAAVVLLTVPLARDRYRNLGHTVIEERLVVSYGSLVRRRSVLAAEGIIGWNLHQSFFQRRARVVTLVATTAAGRQAYRMQDLTPDETLAVAEAALPGLLRPFIDAAPGR